MNFRLIIWLLIVCHSVKLLLELIYLSQNRHDYMNNRFILARVVDIIAWAIYAMSRASNVLLFGYLANTLLIMSSIIKIKEVLKVKKRYGKRMGIIFNLAIVAIPLINLFVSIRHSDSHGMRAIILYGISFLLWIYPSYILYYIRSSIVQKSIAVAYMSGLMSCIVISYISIKLISEDSFYIIDGISVINLLILYITLFLGNMSISLFFKEISANKMQQLADYDSLTNLMNRRRFIIESNDMIRVCARRKIIVTCLLIDIDDFKMINDTWGHQVGDTVLTKFAEQLKDMVELPSVVGRIGGEEFAVLLADVNKEKGFEIAESIRKRIELKSEDEDISYTISIGMSSLIPKENTSLDICYEQSDRSLYRAKRLGKNCVQAY